MRRRNIKDASTKVNMSKYIIDSMNKIDFKTLFNNDNPNHIEIGMGKGNFIIEMAKTNPNINFIGIEKYSSVILQATKKLDKLELIPNLKLINMDAEKLMDVFNEKSIDLIYLNFSDPWPKKRHSKRRLTHKNFLDKYSKIVKDARKLMKNKKSY